MSAEFPFIGTDIEVEETELPLFRQPAWDFNNDEFLYDENHNHIFVTGKEALKIWIYKVLKTERFSYIAYSWQYGIELQPFIGKVMSVQERYSELKRMITECLMVNPYIKSIDSIEFDAENREKDVTITVNLTTVYGEASVDV